MRILVIEDEQKVSALIKRGLISERYAVDVAADGIDGLELAEAYPYDLMILDHVWDQSFDGITNIVDVYVRHLRSKVDDGNLFKMIRTVRGTGYTIRSGNET